MAMNRTMNTTVSIAGSGAASLSDSFGKALHAGGSLMLLVAIGALLRGIDFLGAGSRSIVVLNNFVYKVGIPSLVCRSLATQPFSQINWSFVVAFLVLRVVGFVVALVTTAAIVVFTRLRRRKSSFHDDLVTRVAVADPATDNSNDGGAVNFILNCFVLRATKQSPRCRLFSTLQRLHWTNVDKHNHLWQSDSFGALRTKDWRHVRSVG